MSSDYCKYDHRFGSIVEKVEKSLGTWIYVLLSCILALVENEGSLQTNPFIKITKL